MQHKLGECEDHEDDSNPVEHRKHRTAELYLLCETVVTSMSERLTDPKINSSELTSWAYTLYRHVQTDTPWNITDDDRLWNVATAIRTLLSPSTGMVEFYGEVLSRESLVELMGSLRHTVLEQNVKNRARQQRQRLTFPGESKDRQLASVLKLTLQTQDALDGVSSQTAAEKEWSRVDWENSEVYLSDEYTTDGTAVVDRGTVLVPKAYRSQIGVTYATLGKRLAVVFPKDASVYAHYISTPQTVDSVADFLARTRSLWSEDGVSPTKWNDAKLPLSTLSSWTLGITHRNHAKPSTDALDPLVALLRITSSDSGGASATAPISPPFHVLRKLEPQGVKPSDFDSTNYVTPLVVACVAFAATQLTNGRARLNDIVVWCDTRTRVSTDMAASFPRNIQNQTVIDAIYVGIEDAKPTFTDQPDNRAAFESRFSRIAKEIVLDAAVSYCVQTLLYPGQRYPLQTYNLLVLAWAFPGSQVDSKPPTRLSRAPVGMPFQMVPTGLERAKTDTNLSPMAQRWLACITGAALFDMYKRASGNKQDIQKIPTFFTHKNAGVLSTAKEKIAMDKNQQALAGWGLQYSRILFTGSPHDETSLDYLLDTNLHVDFGKGGYTPAPEMRGGTHAVFPHWSASSPGNREETGYSTFLKEIKPKVVNSATRFLYRQKLWPRHGTTKPSSESLVSRLGDLLLLLWTSQIELSTLEKTEMMEDEMKEDVDLVRRSNTGGDKTLSGLDLYDPAAPIDLVAEGPTDNSGSPAVITIQVDLVHDKVSSDLVYPDQSSGLSTNVYIGRQDASNRLPARKNGRIVSGLGGIRDEAFVENLIDAMQTDIEYHSERSSKANSVRSSVAVERVQKMNEQQEQDGDNDPLE